MLDMVTNPDRWTGIPSFQRNQQHRVLWFKKIYLLYKQTKQIHNNGQQPTHPLNGTAPSTIYTGTQNVKIVNIHKISLDGTLFSCILLHVGFQNGLVSFTCNKSAISQNILNWYCSRYGCMLYKFIVLKKNHGFKDGIRYCKCDLWHWKCNVIQFEKINRMKYKELGKYAV